MRYIADDFIEEAKRQGICYEELSGSKSIEIRENTEDLYCKNGYGALWERIDVDSSGFHAPNNKKIFNEINLDREITLFFEESTDRTMFKLRNIFDLMNVITELFGFVFYITDDDGTFLLCWNDHEFIIGAGKAKEWVENLIQRHKTK